MSSAKNMNECASRSHMSCESSHTDKRKLKIFFSDRTPCEEGKDYYLRLLIRKAIETALDYEKFSRECEVSVTFCDNSEIKELNREFRNKDAATDVLSFPMFLKEELISFPENEIVSLGDIVISLERCRQQAEEIGNTFYRECAFLSVHSTLHLLGYDHELSRLDEEDMCERQKTIMDMLGKRFTIK